MGLTVLALLIAAGSAFAGGGQSGTSGGGGSNSKKPVLTYLYNSGNNIAATEAVAKAFEAKYGVTVEIENGVGGAGDNVIKTRLASGDMSDIFISNTGSLLNALNPEQNMLDLTNEPYVKNLDASFITAASVNGRLYAVPLGPTLAGAWLYNKKIYQQLGLQVPHTWKDLLANLDKIKASGRTALIGAYKDNWTAQLIILADEYNVKVQNPSFPADYTAGKAKYADTPIALRGFEKYAETRQYLNRDYLATTYDDALEMLALGEGAHWPMTTNVLSGIYTLYPDKVDDIGIFGQPGDDPNKHGLTVWVADGIYIYKNSPNIELAKQYLAFSISDEGLKAAFSAVKPDGPLHIKGVTLPNDVYAGVKDMLTYFNEGKTAPALEFESPIKGPILPEICVEVGTGNISPLEAAAAYDADVRKQAVQLNLSGW
jgi:raffinose/stachyose/melibiose transport system substrate-binding protein